MSVLEEPAHHVRPHSAQAYHAYFQVLFLVHNRLSRLTPVGCLNFGCFHIRVPVLVFRARLVISQRRNPPRKALALSPARQPAGNLFNLSTFPPPRTMSSGSNAAARRSTTSAT